MCLPNTCRDGILNAGEDQIDCGGTSLCGDCSAAGSAVGDVNFCSLSFKCSSGEGDCDKPSDCRPGLTCGSDNGARFGFAELIDICVPTTCTDGVLNGGEAEIDCGGTSQCGLCNNPDAANGDAGFCTRTFPCDVDGQGDCDGPADCAGAFYCAHDVGDAGFGFSKVTDVCVDPAGPPVAVYDAPLTGVCGVPITFNGSRSFDRDPAGTLVLFDWSFGEGNVDTGVSVTHTFAAGGSFLVTLRVIDNGFQNDIFQRPIMITCAAK